MWGRYELARRRLTAALQMAEQYDYLRLRDLVLGTLLHLDWFTGAWTGLAGRAEALAELDEPLVHLDAVLVTGFLDAARGLSRTAQEKLQLVLGEEMRRGIIDMPLEPAAALARLRLMEDDADDALALTDEPFQVITAKGIWLWATDVASVRVQALVNVGKIDEAASLVAAFGQGLHGRNAPAPQAALATCRAIVAEGRGEHARAASLFARAATVWQALPRPYDALLARERQGTCLLSTGQDETGLAMLSEAFQGLSGLDARGDADRVMRTLRDHGVRARRPGHGGRHSYGDQLSPRELEVVRLLVTGRTDREIAETLFLSPEDCSPPPGLRQAQAQRPLAYRASSRCYRSRHRFRPARHRRRTASTAWSAQHGQLGRFGEKWGILPIVAPHLVDQYFIHELTSGRTSDECSRLCPECSGLGPVRRRR